MKRPALGLIALFWFTFALQAQINPIPWHPKVKPPPVKGAKEKPPAPQPAAGENGEQRFRLDGDHFTTLEEGVYLVEGNVKFATPGTLITADELIYDTKKETIEATGDVAVDWDDVTMAGSILNYDVKKGSGTLIDAYAVHKDGDFTLLAREIHRLDEEWYEVIDGLFTSCNAAVHPWSMKMSRGKFHVNHYAFLRNPRFRVRNVPIVWLPYLVWPIKPERSSGLLIPEIGSSSRKGLTIQNELFLAPDDWWDDTIRFDYYEKEGLGIGNVLRYALTERDYGWFRGYYIDQDSDGRRRWDAQWTHLHHLGKGWRFIADINLLSDIDFPRDYQRDYTKATRSRTDSRIFFSKQKGSYRFNARAERRLQYFVGDQTLTQKMLPEFEFRSSLRPLGKGLYFGFESSAASLGKEWGEYEGGAWVKRSLDYGRLDVYPFLEWPLHPAPWLDLTPRLEYRSTTYSSPQETGDHDEGGWLWRNYPAASLDAAGPRLYRDFEGGGRHVFEPYFQYRYVGDDSDAALVPLFDEIDSVSLDQNQLRYGIRNRFYDSKGKIRGEAELYQSSSFNRDLSYAGERASERSPITLLCRAWPTQAWSLDFRLRYNILDDAIDSQSLSLTYRPKKETREDFLRLTYLKTDQYGTNSSGKMTLNPSSEEGRLHSALTFLDGKVSLSAFLDRDLLRKRWRHQRGILWYHGSCYSLGLEAGRREMGDFSESSFRFLLSLKGAGTVVDLQGQIGEDGL